MFRRFSQPIQVTRRGVGAYNPATGRYAQGTPTTFETLASVQPLTGKDLDKLPHARKQKGAFTIYTKDKLELPTDGGALGDIVTIHGDRYEVLAMEEWQNRLINHYKYYCGGVL